MTKRRMEKSSYQTKINSKFTSCAYWCYLSLGVCGSGTLDLDPVTTLEQRLIFGMTFYEDKQMWVFALVNLVSLIFNVNRCEYALHCINLRCFNHKPLFNTMKSIVKVNSAAANLTIAIIIIVA